MAMVLVEAKIGDHLRPINSKVPIYELGSESLVYLNDDMVAEVVVIAAKSGMLLVEIKKESERANDCYAKKGERYELRRDNYRQMELIRD